MDDAQFVGDQVLDVELKKEFEAGLENERADH